MFSHFAFLCIFSPTPSSRMSRMRRLRDIPSDRAASSMVASLSSAARTFRLALLGSTTASATIRLPVSSTVQ